jgi:hypothetical protein
MQVYMITLDSHEYIGPFGCHDQAHGYAKLTSRGSYQLVTKLPLHVCSMDIQTPQTISGRKLMRQFRTARRASFLNRQHVGA